MSDARMKTVSPAGAQTRQSPAPLVSFLNLSVLAVEVKAVANGEQRGQHYPGIG